ncbi:hypothetical protein NL676_027707 [Syzygium grande]|nr:hypothetical protein NL676_027707 [Syzygium grande]
MRCCCSDDEKVVPEAIEEHFYQVHESEVGKLLEFSRMVKANLQAASGVMFYVTFRAIDTRDGGHRKTDRLALVLFRSTATKILSFRQKLVI